MDVHLGFRLRKIDPGMTPAQVDELMGQRDGFSLTEKDDHKYTLYQYINRWCNAHFGSSARCDFFVIFKDERVIETGVKNMSDTSPADMQFLYIFKQP